MPNYCENHLTITGRRKDLEVFRDSAVGTDSEGLNPLCFAKLMPIPKHITASKSGKDEAEWLISHWGTRFDAALTQAYLFCDEEGRGQLVYEYLSGNGDPHKLIQVVSAKHPSLIFTLIVTDDDGYVDLYFVRGGKLAKCIGREDLWDENAEEIHDCMDTGWRFVPSENEAS